jgi:hypothetical protein
MPEPILAINITDADDSIFFSRELEYVKRRTYDKKFKQLRYTNFLPVSTEADPGADTITADSYDQVGMAKIISNYADDLPRCDVKATQNTVHVRGLGDSYGFNVQQIRAARLAKKRLPERKAMAARRGIEQLINNIAWTANGEDGMYGLFYFPNISVTSAPTGSWASATGLQMVADMMHAVDYVSTSTNGVEVADTLLMSLAKLRLLTKAPLQTGSDTTPLEYFQKQRPWVKIDWLQECDALDPKPSGGAGPVDVMVAYAKDEDHVTLEMPQMFEQFPAQPRNLEQVVPCHARTAGVFVHYPLSVHVVEGL